MNKIKEIITIKSGMASFVDLRNELFDLEACSKRMASYKPIKSHRDVFERIAKALDPKDRRCYLLTGSYGTGKSHLCLMLANYFMYQSDVRELKEFFNSYAEEDEIQAKKLSLKRSKGRYLIAVPEFGSHQGFEEVVLKSINEALKREEFEGNLNSHYEEAIRRINTWKEQGKSGKTPVNFYDFLCKEIGEKYPNWTINSLLKGLKEYDNNAFQIFCQIHKNITAIDFNYSKDNLVDIIKEINSTKKFQHQFKGIVVIFDEFGYSVQEGRIEPSILHSFFQACTYGNRNWKGNQLIFIGTAHKSLNNLSKSTSAIDLRTLSDRIDEIALQTEGMEDIISAIVIPQKKHPLWQKYIVKKEDLFNQFVTDCNRLNIFNWLGNKKLREKIIENIYPMHPMATYCLLDLAKKIGSDNRSVFTFFSNEFESKFEEVKGSYPWFIQNADIIDNKGRLVLYTADLLFNYFENSLISTNKELQDTTKNFVKNYETTIKELNKYISQKEKEKLFYEKDKLMEQILNIMLIHEIVSISNNKENIFFSLNFNSAEQKKQLESRLDKFIEIKILYYNSISNTYEFKQSSPIDIDQMIEEFKSDEENYPEDVVGSLNQLIPLTRNSMYIEAKKYNQNHLEDKRLLRMFCLPNDLSSNSPTDNNISFFEYLEQKIRTETNFKNSYEGVALYVICENQESIKKAKALISKNLSEHVVIAIPKEPIPVTKFILGLLAIEDIKSKNLIEEYSVQDRALLSEQEHLYKEELIRNRNNYLSVKQVELYERNAKTIQINQKEDYDIADKVITPLYYNYSNKLKHDEFNKIHDIKFGRTKNPALSEAIENLLNRNEHIVIDTESANNRGGIRYLQKCLLNPGALKQIDKKGSKLYCTPERKIEKFRQNLPALANMIEDIQNLEEGKRLNVNTLINKYSQIYGQGLLALSLMFAFVYRYFGDNLKVKQKDAAIGSMSLVRFEDFYDLVIGEYPNAYLEHKEIAVSEHNFINKLYNLFSDKRLAANEDASIIQVYSLMKEWWEKLPQIVKIRDIYKPEVVNIKNIFDIFGKIDSRSEHEFILRDIQTAYGFEPNEIINDKKTIDIIEWVSKDKSTIESSESRIEDKIVKGIREIFDIEGSTYNDIQTGISKWFNSLDDYQRDQTTDYPAEESKYLIKYLSSIIDIRNTFFEDLPSSPGFNLGRISDWNADKSNEYIDKIRKGKTSIEVRIENAVVSFNGEYNIIKNSYILYKGELIVHLEHKDPTAKIFITTDESDPKSEYSQREKVVGRFERKIKNSFTLKFVSQDREGNFSCITKLHLTNEFEKNEIILPKQLTIQESPVTFYFPMQLKGLIVTVKSLLRNALEKKVINKNELQKEMKNILNEILKGK